MEALLSHRHVGPDPLAMLAGWVGDLNRVLEHVLVVGAELEAAEATISGAGRALRG